MKETRFLDGAAFPILVPRRFLSGKSLPPTSFIGEKLAPDVFYRGMSETSMEICSSSLLNTETGFSLTNDTVYRTKSWKRTRNPAFSQAVRFSNPQKKPGFLAQYRTKSWKWTRNPAFSQAVRFSNPQKKPGFLAQYRTKSWKWTRNPAFSQAVRFSNPQKSRVSWLSHFFVLYTANDRQPISSALHFAERCPSWLKEHDWKSCVLPKAVPRVRTPLSPPPDSYRWTVQ